MDGVTTVTDRGVPPDEQRVYRTWEVIALGNRRYDAGHAAGLVEARASQPLTLDVERLARAMEGLI